MQCPQCREPNDDRARFCLGCGAGLQRALCASCQHALPVAARFCPECGQSVEPSPPRTVTPPSDIPAAVPENGALSTSRFVPRTDPAEVLLAARDPSDGEVDDEEHGDDEELEDVEHASPDELQIVQTVRRDRARRARRRRALLAVVAVSLLVIVAAVVAHRLPRGERTAGDATSASDPAASRDETAATARPEGPATSERETTTAARGRVAGAGGSSTSERAATDAAPAGNDGASASKAAGPDGAAPGKSAPAAGIDDAQGNKSRSAAAANGAKPRSVATGLPEKAAGAARGSKPVETTDAAPDSASAGSVSAQDVGLPPRASSANERATTRARDTAAAPAHRTGATERVPESPAPPARRSVQIASPDPAALPGTAAPPKPNVRIDVKQAPSAAAPGNAPRTVDYTVRVSHEGGGPVADADVRLRGLTVDGVLVEAQLDPSSEPGVYRGAVPLTPRGPNNLTVRVVRPDGVVEVPVSGASATR